MHLVLCDKLVKLRVSFLVWNSACDLYPVGNLVRMVVADGWSVLYPQHHVKVWCSTCLLDEVVRHVAQHLPLQDDCVEERVKLLRKFPDTDTGSSQQSFPMGYFSGMSLTS